LDEKDMKIVICASISAAKKVVEIAEQLEKNGHEVMVPKDIEKYADGTLNMETPYESTQNKIKDDLIKGYFEKIKNSEAVLVVNLDKKGITNYIGGNTFLEIGFAYVLNKKIYLLNEIPEISYKDEIIAMRPMVISGDLENIK
jgi:predicted RNA-binding protein with PUA domain